MAVARCFGSCPTSLMGFILSMFFPHRLVTKAELGSMAPLIISGHRDDSFVIPFLSCKICINVNLFRFSLLLHIDL